ncbi:MAG: hypothetical protein ABW168_05425 [Sedimenticola sp.]
MTLPDFLLKDFIASEYRTISIDNLYVGVVSGTNNRIVYKQIFDTPHYIFVKSKINVDYDYNESNQNTSYKAYSDNNAHACSEDNFIELITKIKDQDYDWQNSPILVFKHWSKLIPFNRWYVADGFHRLAILAALNKRNIKVHTLKYKLNIFQRFLKRVKNI